MPEMAAVVAVGAAVVAAGDAVWLNR